MRREEAKAVIVPVTEERHIALARQKAVLLAEEIGLERVLVYHVATAVSELAGNLVFHATQGGTITLTPVERDGKIGIEVVAQDDSPGIPDVELALQDGFSTGGGLGSGLPGVRRLMDEFEITSTVGVGTRVVTRKWR